MLPAGRHFPTSLRHRMIYRAAMHCQKIALIGLGLLGGSLGLAARQRKLAARIVGYVRRQASVVECEQLQLVDQATTNLAEAVADADLVVLCTPLGQMREMAEKLGGSLAP